MHTIDAPPEPGTTHILKIEWTGRPTPKVVRPYIAWMNSVNQQLSNEWGVGMIHIFKVHPGPWIDANLEAWEYQPNERPRKAALPAGDHDE